ncbi:hypothetical protein NEUTE1DRAFT_39086 [Neurospora tetrasperma FGSC 2508]|uniref:Uncharacterized protein n=1 Tax=Neurospora tetrasperma (strain FGSC 2508 / ATCC MYA-4615 / P0657) TaxID=510951 RepID=F8MGH4_NEUT8|nr:uncharacterized protein NEUTE1DRAFT_39086 [Neurospora tetrasperma FGSC 2508]EGO59446.1 hypothetical protein NEUTE1DRAFT_39086 [Neurospora tetrasperma FGSC 2508]EGZ73573.1 hypothetical protein NEUTE2DRAFT_127925 [Neurospora tetrasperma FGSC 2509]
MGSHSVFPFLHLPAELRLEIYRHAWTVSEEDHVYRAYYPYDDSNLGLTVDYLKAQLSAIRKLGAISQRIRTESYSEYFDHTQIMLRYDCVVDIDDSIGDHVWDDRNRSALYIIGSSYLLQTQARHVYLHWPARSEYHILYALFGVTRVDIRMREELLNEQWAFGCLSRFRNLRSLDVHMCEGLVDLMGGKKLKRLLYDGDRRAKLIEALKTHHQKLEKAVVRTDLDDPEDIKDLNELHAFKWWRRLKKDIAVLASEGPSSAVCT